MKQVLFYIPLSSINESWRDVPIFGYGMMLFITFLITRWVAIRLARREGYRPEIIDNLALCMFIFGIIGARVLYMFQMKVPFNVQNFVAIWDGGLIFYGSVFGGIVGYIVAHFLFLKREGVSTWKMVDILAPCLALGLAVGRFGCLLNGCCYGNVACVDCPAIHFPLAAAPREVMTARGYQTAAGFTVYAAPTRAAYVDHVDPDSAAHGVVQPGDKLVSIELKDTVDVKDVDQLNRAMGANWVRGKNDLQMTVERNGQTTPLEPFVPRGIGLHPTQVYESISMGLMAFLLLSWYPLKKRDGMLMVVCMFGYGVHRFLNEMLRTDTPPVAFGLTLSQNISVLILTGAVVLFVAVLVLQKPPRSQPNVA